LKYILLFILSFSLYGKDGYDLIVKVNNLRNTNGVVQYSIYNKPDSLPDEHFKKYYLQKTAKIVNNSSEVVFKNLPKGVYAVNILHDENKNHQIDKGFMLPKEGVGLSNYEKINLFNKPNFKNAGFILNKDKEISVKVIYF